MDLLIDNNKLAELQKIAPSNVLAEQIVLGSILNMNENMMRVADLLQGWCFYEPFHQKIYELMDRLIDKGLRADPVTLKNYFDNDEAFKEFGGGDYLARLSALASSQIVNLADYARAIHDLAIRRKLIEVGEDIVNEAYDASPDHTADQQIEAAESVLFDLANERAYGSTGFVSLKDSMRQSLERTQHAKKLGQKVVGISSGYTDLDDLLGGLQDSDLLIIAGRPSMGKTALAVNVAINAAKYIKEKANLEKKKDTKKDASTPSIGFFSLEMSAEQLASRILSMETSIASNSLRLGHVSPKEFTDLTQAARELSQMPFFIDDTPALSISALRTRARRLKRKHDLSMLVVDYLQLLTGSNKNKENRVQEISEITQGLKAIAKELNIPVIALSQLSRSVEQREDKRPQLSDLRESGSIEQDADVVMFIYREEYYLGRRAPTDGDDEKANKYQERMNEVANKAEVIVAKHRNGPIGTAVLHFDHSFTRFSNLAKEDEK